MQKDKKVLGTLLPLTALGTFDDATDFLQWLQTTQQSAWQLLPLHETQLESGSTTKHVPSPYKSYGIGLDPKYLPNRTIKTVNNKIEKEKFIAKNKEWLHDYALFCSFRDHFGTDDWTVWEDGLSTRDEQKLETWATKLANKIETYTEQQWTLHCMYAEFHSKAKAKGIALIGDLPYYPSFRSPLVWAHQNVFQIDKDGKLPYVSGIPNSKWTHFGRQVWGHPLYNWDEEKEQVITFWKMRLRYLSTIFDDIRFDHAKAFFSYGVIDVANPDKDHFTDGPGEDVFKELVAFSRSLGLTVFAEDSGEKTVVLRKTLAEIGMSGIRIFRFAMKEDQINSRYGDIINYPKECVAYTTTHDTETLLSYLQSLSTEQKNILSKGIGINYTNDKQFATNIRNAVIQSAAELVIIPMQDWLLSTDRINIPGTEKEVGDTNWQYKLNIPLEKLPTTLD